MIERRVPIRSSGWSGMGTVLVDSPSCHCMTTWLPRRRTSTKPCLARMRQTSRPERVRSLPNLHVERRDVELALEALPDLTLARSLKEEGDRLLDVMASLLDAVALAGNVEFGAQGNVAVPFVVDPGSDMLDALHPFIMIHLDLTRRVGQGRPAVTKNLRILSQILKAAVRNRLIAFNPCDGVEGPGETPREETVFLTPEEVNAMADAVGERFGPMVLLAGYRGAALRRACGAATPPDPVPSSTAGGGGRGPQALPLNAERAK